MLCKQNLAVPHLEWAKTHFRGAITPFYGVGTKQKWGAL